MRGGITLRKFISFALCAALLVTSSGAADVYEVEGDTSSFSLVRSTAYDAATTSVTESEMESLFVSYLGSSSPLLKFLTQSGSWSNLYTLLLEVTGSEAYPGSYTIGGRLDSLLDILEHLGLGTSSPSSYSLGSYLSSIKDSISNFRLDFSDPSDSPLFYSGTYLNSSGNSAYITYGTIPEILGPGFAGLSANIKALNTAFDFSEVVSAVNSTTTAVGKVESAVDDVVSAVDDTTSAVNSTTSAVNGTTSAVEDNTSAVNATTSAVQANTSTLNSTFKAYIDSLKPYYYQNTGTYYLNFQGTTSQAASDITFSFILRNGFVGLSTILHNIVSSISGNVSSHTYSGSLIDNENQTSSFVVTGLGPMLQKYLQEIQHDSGLLTYIFASPEDLAMKENSSSNMSSVNDTFINPESSTSVSASDIGSLGSAAGSIEGLGQTGVTPDQAFTQLSNDSIFEFFTSTTAGNLDTTVSTFARGDLSDHPSKTIVTDYFEQSRIEFYELIGEGVG